MSGLSPEQLEQRLGGITATDISAICGVNPWKREIDVWLDKTGAAPPFEGNLKTKWGMLLEPIIRDDYEEIHQVRVDLTGTLKHRHHDWWLATPDGLVYPRGSIEPDRGLEIKVHGPEALRVLSYGDPGTDQVPLHELFQCVWGMGVTGLDRWDLVAFLGGSPSEFVIQRDDELLGMLAERAEKFWRDHVQSKTPPEPDGSDSWTRYLEQRFAKPDDKILLVDDEYTLSIIADLRDAKAALDRDETRVKELSQHVKRIIDGHAGITYKDQGRPISRSNKAQMSTIKWQFNKPSIVVDHAAIAKDRKDRAALTLGAHEGTLQHAIDRLTAPVWDAEIDRIERPVIATALGAIVESLQAIAGTAVEEEHTSEVPGNRPFNCPRYWGKTNTAA